MSIENWLLLLSIIFCIVAFSVIFINKQKQEIAGWRFMLMVLFAFLILSVLGFDVLARNNYSFDTIRNITTFLSVVIAVVSLVTTVYFTNRTSKTNRENKNSDFLMSLMKNHYELLNSKHEHIDKLIVQLEDQFIGKAYIIDKSVEKFKCHLIIHSNEGLNLKISTLQANIDSIKGNKDNLNNDLKKLRKIIDDDNDEAIIRLFISYYLNKDEYKDTFLKLSKTYINKSFSKEFIDLLKIDDGFFKMLDKFLSHNKDIMDELDYDSICSICSNIFDDAYKDVGHFFRNSYRVLKEINKLYKADLDSKNNYQGILRSQYGENVILAIYYNSAFTNKGLGYANELLASDFFGSNNDLQLDDPIHFRKENLFFDKRDLGLMKKLFISDVPKKTYENLDDLQKAIKNAFDYS